MDDFMAIYALIILKILKFYFECEIIFPKRKNFSDEKNFS